MANTRSGNLHYVDATGQLRTDATRVSKILLTATAASAVLELRDKDDSKIHMYLGVATSGETQQFDFSPPALFPNGLYAHTVTNAKATIITTQSGEA